MGAEDSRRRSASANWGGGRLGDGSSTQSGERCIASGGYGQSGEQTFADRMGQAASRTGENISSAASKAGDNISAAASVAGERLSAAGSWLRSSVSSSFGGNDQTASASNAGNSAGMSGVGRGFQAFQGQGRTLGSGDGNSTVAARPPR